MSEKRQQLNVIAKVAMLGFSILFAAIRYAANLGEGDNAQLLGAVSAPFIFAGLGVGIAKAVAKRELKRPSEDYFVITVFILTILIILSRLSRLGQQV